MVLEPKTLFISFHEINESSCILYFYKETIGVGALVVLVFCRCPRLTCLFCRGPYMSVRSESNEACIGNMLKWPYLTLWIPADAISFFSNSTCTESFMLYIVVTCEPKGSYLMSRIVHLYDRSRRANNCTKSMQQKKRIHSISMDC